VTKGHPETRSVEGSALVVLSKKDIETLLPMSTCMELMEAALASLARGEVIHPLRPVVPVPQTKNVFAVMPAYSTSLKAFGTKLISVYPDNHGTSFHSHQGLVVLFDGEHGNPVAMMDASSITAIRTAAVSGVATRLLARANATSVAILGAGVQARTHASAMLAARPFKRVVVWARARDKAQQLAAELAKTHGASFDVAAAVKEAVEEADVVCTVTAAREPVLRGDWVRPGTHINAVGASLKTTRELDTETVRRSRIYVDRRESALNEAGDLLIPMQEGAISADAIVGEIGEVLTGVVAGRGNEREITLFKSLGLAIEDLACARYLYGAATPAGVGQRVEL
jgi:ornithine cyclodeaminase/alanine dehydrogenase-like protein (mu-crystallin family)